MAVDLSQYVDVLRREITPPGSGNFANVSDDVMTGYLADAFWEARLDGFVQGYTADTAGVVTPEDPTAIGDLPRDHIALLVLYAGIRILRNQILNTQTSLRVQAGPVEYEAQNSAAMLVEMLRQLKAIKDRLFDMENGFGMTSVQLIDGYSVRQIDSISYAGYWGDLFNAHFGSLEVEGV